MVTRGRALLLRASGRASWSRGLVRADAKCLLGICDLDPAAIWPWACSLFSSVPTARTSWAKTSFRPNPAGQDWAAAPAPAGGEEMQDLTASAQYYSCTSLPVRCLW